MNRLVRKTTILIAFAVAAPLASAGNNIVKCVDTTGHVTLTDQPCPAGAATVPMDAGPAGPGVVTVERYPAPAATPAGAAQWRQSAPKRMTLKRDVATLKEARAQWLLMDAAGKQPHTALAAN
jgi:hypothetical protein